MCGYVWVYVVGYVKSDVVVVLDQYVVVCGWYGVVISIVLVFEFEVCGGIQVYVVQWMFFGVVVVGVGVDL